jgi:anti-sigma factor RsiW
MTREHHLAQLTAYIDGALSEEEATAMREAIASDPALATAEARLRAAVSAMAQLPPSPEASPAFRRAVLARLEAPLSVWQRLVALVTPKLLVPVGAVAAAAVVAVVTHESIPPSALPVLDEEALALATEFDALDTLELAQVGQPDDLEVVLNLDSLEEGRP